MVGCSPTRCPAQCPSTMCVSNWLSNLRASLVATNHNVWWVDLVVIQAISFVVCLAILTTAPHLLGVCRRRSSSPLCQIPEIQFETSLRQTQDLGSLLLHVSRQVVGRIIDVDKGPVDDGNGLQDVLQALTIQNVVRRRLR